MFVKTERRSEIQHKKSQGGNKQKFLKPVTDKIEAPKSPSQTLYIFFHNSPTIITLSLLPLLSTFY